jgi:hypothetical protein
MNGMPRLQQKSANRLVRRRWRAEWQPKQKRGCASGASEFAAHGRERRWNDKDMAIARPNVRAKADRGGRRRKAGLRECTPYLRPALRRLPEWVGG